MKTLLSITVFAVLCTDCVSQFDGNVSSALNNTNITQVVHMTTRTPEALKNATEPPDVELLRCHVCLGSFQCLAPQDCAVEEKFCMIAETVEKDESSVIKYCSIMCPFMDQFYGRTSEDLYLACCAEDLCNYKKLGRGHRLCVSVLVVSMAILASFLGPLGLDCDMMG